MEVSSIQFLELLLESLHVRQGHKGVVGAGLGQGWHLWPLIGWLRTCWLSGRQGQKAGAATSFDEWITPVPTCPRADSLVQAAGGLPSLFILDVLAQRLQLLIYLLHIFLQPLDLLLLAFSDLRVRAQIRLVRQLLRLRFAGHHLQIESTHHPPHLFDLFIAVLRPLRHVNASTALQVQYPLDLSL